MKVIQPVTVQSMIEYLKMFPPEFSVFMELKQGEVVPICDMSIDLVDNIRLRTIQEFERIDGHVDAVVLCSHQIVQIEELN